MAAATKSTLLAVDTNFLLDLAADAAAASEGLETMERRLPQPVIFALGRRFVHHASIFIYPSVFGGQVPHEALPALRPLAHNQRFLAEKNGGHLSQ
ncbi:MAG: hypothetical protein RL077_1504 [Verrucomicrobiota bacterium]